MKYLIALIFALPLCSCETTTNEDGSTTTRWDAKATTEAINTGFSAYDKYQRQFHIIGYDAYGNPVYAQ